MAFSSSGPNPCRKPTTRGDSIEKGNPSATWNKPDGTSGSGYTTPILLAKPAMASPPWITTLCVARSGP